MKKAISLLLAASVLCFATSAFAATNSISTVGSAPRNGVNTFNTTYAGGNARTVSMPCFRAGDTLSFNLSALTVNNELTVISYKYGSTPSDATVQYINQYTVSNASKTISYTIRDKAAGVYVLKFNDAASEVATYYYKIGKASTVLWQNSSGTSTTTGFGTPCVTQGPKNGVYSVGFLGKVTVDAGADVTLEQMGAHPGFQVTNGSKTKGYGFGLNLNVNNTGKSVAGLESTNFEIGGSYSYIYGVTVYNVPAANTVTAKAVLDATN